MATVETLVPGDRIELGGQTAIYVQQADHPLYPGLRLVIWKLERSGAWSHDALSPLQYVGEADPFTDRQANLRFALQGVTV